MLNKSRPIQDGPKDAYCIERINIWLMRKITDTDSSNSFTSNNLSFSMIDDLYQVASKIIGPTLAGLAGPLPPCLYTLHTNRPESSVKGVETATTIIITISIRSASILSSFLLICLFVCLIAYEI